MGIVSLDLMKSAPKLLFDDNSSAAYDAALLLLYYPRFVSARSR